MNLSLRLRILEALIHERTTKQVAEEIGEKPTRLYHHVEALARVGLIRLTRTRQNRGTVEKYYAAVARAFTTDPALFHGAGGADDDGKTLRKMISTVMDGTAEELNRLVAAGQAGRLEDEGLLSFVELRATQQDVDELRTRLRETLEAWAAKCCDDPEPEGARRYRLTLAYFPLDRTPPES